MKEPIEKRIELGRSGEVTFHVSGDRKRLRMEFTVLAEGLDKAEVNAVIDALKKIRDKMDR